MCYHTHSSPNESIDFAVLWRTQSIDSFGKNGDIFSICTIYIFQTFFGTFPMTFLQKFSNQKVQFSIKINNIPKKPFEKSVRNISIHLKLLKYFFLIVNSRNFPPEVSFSISNLLNTTLAKVYFPSPCPNALTAIPLSGFQYLQNHPHARSRSSSCLFQIY